MLVTAILIANNLLVINYRTINDIEIVITYDVTNDTILSNNNCDNGY